MEELEYYIVSLKWTKKRDAVVTLWRSNDNGYCYYRSWAGKYKESDVKNNRAYYNNNESTKAVPCNVIDNLWIRANYYGRSEEFLFNDPETRDKLGIEKRQLLGSIPSITREELRVIV